MHFNEQIVSLSYREQQNSFVIHDKQPVILMFYLRDFVLIFARKRIRINEMTTHLKEDDIYEK